MVHNVIIITTVGTTTIDLQNVKFKPYYVIVIYLSFKCYYYPKMRMNYASTRF